MNLHHVREHIPDLVTSPSVVRGGRVPMIHYFAAVLYGWSFFERMWVFNLVSPQYPLGLKLEIFLNRLGGDVDEVNLINHYIGMGRLDEAAQLERSLSGLLIGAIVLAILIAGFFRRHSLAKWLRLPAIVFPLAFFVFFYFWMYHFGHHLSPHAPVQIAPFTPSPLGYGKIGQFETTAGPGLGFWLMALASTSLMLATWLEKINRGKNGM